MLQHKTAMQSKLNKSFGLSVVCGVCGLLAFTAVEGFAIALWLIAFCFWAYSVFECFIENKRTGILSLLGIVLVFSWLPVLFWVVIEANKYYSSIRG